MLTAGRDNTKSRLLITHPQPLLFTFKNHASPWPHNDPPTPNPFVSATLSTRLTAALLLRHAGSSCMLTFRTGTEELFILPICSAPHGNGVEHQHAHGWLPWPLEANARVHPLELTPFQHGHPHNDLWKSLFHFQSCEEQHPLFTCTTFPVDQQANRVTPDVTPACFTHTPWSAISPTRKIWTHIAPSSRPIAESPRPPPGPPQEHPHPEDSSYPNRRPHNPRAVRPLPNNHHPHHQSGRAPHPNAPGKPEE